MARPIGESMRLVYKTLGSKFRRKRALTLRKQFQGCESVLDVGGTNRYWLQSEWRQKKLTILNIVPPPAIRCPGAAYVQADALAIPVAEQSFDLAMSNSVIEHVPDQRTFAAEMMRVGRRIYCQTPAKEFPIEPHCLGLFVHWLPRGWFTHFIHRWFTIYGWVAKPDRQEHAEFLDEVRLLSRRDLEKLFPGCSVEVERFLGWPKSYIVTRRNTE